MKLISKDALILGGWAVALEAPLSYLPQEGIISDIIFVIDTAFFICLLFLLFNKVPSFIQKTKEKLPTLAFFAVLHRMVRLCPYFYRHRRDSLFVSK